MLRKRIVLIAVLLAVAFPAGSAAIEQQNSNIPGRLYEKRPLDFDHDRILRLRQRPYGMPYEFFGRRYYTGQEKYHRYDYRPNYYRNYRTWGDY